MKRENYILVLIVAIVLLYSAILPAQTITILSPNGGENWKAGSQHEIKWTSSGFSGPVMISVSYDGWAPKFWLIVEHSTANDGSYMWTLPYNYKSSTCVIRIQDAADGDPYDLSNAFFTISSPEGTFNFDDGTDQNWTVAGPYGDQGGGPVSSHFFSLWKDDVNYPNPPGKDPTNNDGSFSLGTLNGHGITGGLTGTFWIMQLKSPDLTNNAIWQSANGFTVRIADCMGWSNIYANLYVTVYDKSQSKERTFFSGTAQILSYDTYGDWDAVWNSLSFDWSSISSFPSNYEVKRVMVYIWGHLAGYYEGGVYLDEVVPTFSNGPNTLTGTNVSVNAGSGVEVTFDNVAGAGNTTVTTKSNGTPPPGGFQVVPSSSPVYYDVETTATFSGNVEICIEYNDAGMTPAQEAALKLQVYENPPGAWKDITSSLNTGTNIICGTVNHLSEFAIMFSSGAPDIAVNPNAIDASVAGGESTVESCTISNSGNADLTFDISGQKWEKMPGSARDIGVGDDGEAWVIGTNKIGYGYDIYRWTGTEWKGMPGGAMTIDVGSQNQIVVVNDADDIFQWDGSNWQPLPGKARQVSIASDGTMWAIGENAVFGGFEILKWNGLGWDLMPGGAVKIGVGSKNHIWCVSELNLIYRWNGSDWDLIPGVGSDISVGSDGEVWVVSNIATTGGNEIFRWNGTDWNKQPAGAVAIGVGSASHIWNVNDVGEIYRWNSSGLALPAWLNVSQLTGTVTPGGQQDITVTLDAATLTPDTYFANLFVNSNDPDEPFVQIPVTLEVLGASLAVTSPNGGEKWSVGSSHNITWSSQSLSNPVKIEYSIDNGSNYTTIVPSTSNDGSYTWTIPNKPSTNCLVRVSDATDGNPSDVSNAVFTISSSGNTPTGTNVEVDVGNSVKVTFDNITSSGETTLDVKTNGPPPPSGFKIMPSGLPVYYDIKTTAGFTGNITICISYNDAGMTPTEEANLRLNVYEVPPGKWKDITKLPVDTANNIICGTINHLTVFAMMIGPSHFTFTSPTQESYSLVIDNATLDGAQLAIGDEIGVFTPDGLCVGASVWDGSTPLALTAWADDSQTNGVDGYKSGDKMSFRIWDAGAGTQDDYPAASTYSAGNGNFGDGAFARLSLTALTSVTQALALQKGWSWFSFNVAPPDLSLESIMASVNNLVIVVNGAGQFYIPNVINSIGSVSVLEGYKIYVSAPAQVSVTGKPVGTATPIALKAGWNFVSYLPATAMSAETALASVLTQLAIIKNDAGKFFIPNVINSLGNMTPGEGYKLYLNADATLIYPNGSALAKQGIRTAVTHTMRPAHFKFRARTGESHSVVIHSLRIHGRQPETGDEVGLFTADGLCVGAGVWKGSGVIGIAAWADDERTEAVDGFREGEEILFRFWDAGEDREIPLKAAFTQGSGIFANAPFTVVDLESADVPSTFSLAQNYPNPFNAGTVISYRLSRAAGVVLKVYNLFGEEVQTLVDEKKNAGSYKVNWDGRNYLGKAVPSGIYIYRLKAGPFSAVKKAVYMK